VLKTIEQILGLGSLTYFDDRAESFAKQFPDATGLHTLQRQATAYIA
jgi:hypothetical protein